MTEGLADGQGRPTLGHARLYKRWADGGLGLSITGNVMVMRGHYERPANVVLDGATPLEPLKAWAAAGKANGAQLIMQLNHPGRQAPKAVTPEPVSASNIGLKLGGMFAEPRPLTEAEILDLIGRFAGAAAMARSAGFDGVQIHAAHGYLLSQFLSPLTNKRTDAWGGSLENRARFLIEIVRATRKGAGRDFILSVKLNSADFQKGGFSPADGTAVAGMLAAEGIDLLEISGGSYEQPRMAGMEGDAGAAEVLTPSTAAREAYFLTYAADMRRVFPGPLMVTGGFRTRAGMNAALQSGAADVIGLGRPLCATTDAPGKLVKGLLDELPAYEKTLRIGPGRWLGPQSPLQLIKAMNGWGQQGWFCTQLLRMGAGLDPDLYLGCFAALRAYQQSEAKARQALAKGA